MHLVKPPLGNHLLLRANSVTQGVDHQAVRIQVDLVSRRDHSVGDISRGFNLSELNEGRVFLDGLQYIDSNRKNTPK
jgi:hypothetical protein